MLQTVLNPLQRTVGGEENYAFIAELAQFMFGIASFLSPLVYTYLIRELDPATYTAGKGFFIDLLADITPREMPWVSHIREYYMTEDFIITKDKYGDWCVPPESLELIHSKDPSRKTDGALIATAYYLKVLQLMHRFASLQNI